MPTIQELLLEKYLEWQKESGERKTLKEFAKYLGVGEVHLNLTMNGRRTPSLKLIEKIANFYGDLRFYDAINLPRPDPLLHYITRHWGEISPELRHKFAEEISNYITEPLPDHE